MNLSLPNLKAIGPYLIALLVIVRFVIMPLNHAIEQKKLLLAERQELYRTKQSLREKQESDAVKPSVDLDEASRARLFYAKDSPDSAIQADLLKGLMETAEKIGLGVLNFELPDVTRGKELSEVGVILRLRGQPKGVVALLRAIENSPRPLSIKSFEIARSGADQMITLSILAFRIER